MENNRHSDEIEHTHSCAHWQRGSVCDCGAWEAMGIDLSHVEPTRGIDYSRLAGGVAEGIPGEEEGNE